MEKTDFMKKVKLAIIIDVIFQVSLITYLVMLLMETVKVGFVSNYFNLNLLLGVVFVSGVFMVLTGDWYSRFKSQKKSITEKDIYYIISVSLGAGALIYYKTKELGKISIAISIIAVLIILLLSLLIFSEDNSN